MAATTTFVKAKTTLMMQLENPSGRSDATLTSTDHNIKFFDIGISPEIEAYAQAFASGRHSKARSAMGKRKVTFTAKAQLLTSGSTATPPTIGKAFEACGLLRSAPASTQTYKPDASKDEGVNVTASIWAVLVSSANTAVIVKGKGCMGNCVISMDSLGTPLVASFTFTGALLDIVDGTPIAMHSTLDAGVSPSTIGSVITAAGVTQQASKFSLDFGNTIELDQDPADTTGYAAAYIAKRAPKLMLTPKLKRIVDDGGSTNASYARWVAGTEAAFSLATAANGAGNLKYTVSAPKAQLTANPFGNNGEEWAWNQTYELHESSGNDEFSIVMSA